MQSLYIAATLMFVALGGAIPDWESGPSCAASLALDASLDLKAFTEPCGSCDPENISVSKTAIQKNSFRRLESKNACVSLLSESEVAFSLKERLVGRGQDATVWLGCFEASDKELIRVLVFNSNEQKRRHHPDVKGWGLPIILEGAKELDAAIGYRLINPLEVRRDYIKVGSHLGLADGPRLVSDTLGAHQSSPEQIDRNCSDHYSYSPGPRDRRSIPCRVRNGIGLFFGFSALLVSLYFLHYAASLDELAKLGPAGRYYPIYGFAFMYLGAIIVATVVVFGFRC